MNRTLAILAALLAFGILWTMFLARAGHPEAVWLVELFR